jgi:hypothetical protein
MNESNGQPEVQNNDYAQANQTRKENECSFLSYESDSALYALGFSNNRGQNLRVALGTYTESDNNAVKILEVPSDKQSINLVTQIEHQYPPTKIKFHPDVVI